MRFVPWWLFPGVRPLCPTCDWREKQVQPGFGRLLFWVCDGCGTSWTRLHWIAASSDTAAAWRKVLTA